MRENRKNISASDIVRGKLHPARLPAGMLTDAQNLGTSGARVLSGVNNSVAEFRRLIAGTNISLNEEANTITITATGQNGGGDVTSVFGRTGDVIAQSGDYGMAQITGEIDNTQHGLRAGGNLHAIVTTTVAGFMSGADKTKLNGIESGAQVNVVTSVFGRTGAVVAQEADYSSFYGRLGSANTWTALNRFSQPVRVDDGKFLSDTSHFQFRNLADNAFKPVRVGTSVADANDALNRAAGDGRYGRLAAANTWTAVNTFTNTVIAPFARIGEGFSTLELRRDGGTADARRVMFAFSSGGNFEFWRVLDNGTFENQIFRYDIANSIFHFQNNRIQTNNQVRATLGYSVGTTTVIDSSRDGFLRAVKLTRDIEWTDTHDDRHLKNTAFSPGFQLQGGEGGFFGFDGSAWRAEVDSLLVRRDLRVAEFIVDRARAIEGTELMTVARGKIAEVTHLQDNEYAILLEDPYDTGLNPFVDNDRFIIQRVRPGAWDNPTNPHNDIVVKHIRGLVYELGEHYSGDPMSFAIDSDGAQPFVGAPEPGDYIIQAWHPTATERQNIIVRSVSTANGALVYTRNGINSWSAFDTVSRPDNDTPGVAYNGLGEIKLYTNAQNFLRKTTSALTIHATNLDLRAEAGDWHMHLRNTNDRQGLYVFNMDGTVHKSILSVGRIYQLDDTLAPDPIEIEATARQGIMYEEWDGLEIKKYFELSNTVREIGGISFNDSTLWSVHGGNYTGMRKALAADTKVLFAGATGNSGANAKFYVTPDGNIFHPSIVSLLLSQAGTATNTVDAVVDSGIDWKHTGPTLGTKAGVYYIHRAGINRIYLKYERRLTDPDDSGRIRLSLRPRGGGTPISTHDDDFTTSTTFTDQVLSVDVSGLTNNTIYFLDIAIGAWFGPNPPLGEIHMRSPIMYGTATIET